MQPRHIPRAQLELIRGPVTLDGGELRVLQGSEYGLVTSVMHSTVVPGSGPKRHRHPHAEIFVLHEGRARFEAEGTHLDAVAGDMVIVPPDAWHTFTNTGTAPLRLTGIHENLRAKTEYVDGTRRD
jgi:quercetin dioxygenase-like cupin family protein